MNTKLTFPVFVIVAAGAMVVGLLASAVFQNPVSASATRELCIASSQWENEALTSIGSDLKSNVTTTCRGTVPQALRGDYDPNLAMDTAVLDRQGPQSEPRFSAAVVVVDRGSRAYEVAASTGFIADARYHCRGDNCFAVGYEVYVTPEEVTTDRVDKLVAIAFGTPRNPCADPTPKWIQQQYCDGGQLRPGGQSHSEPGRKQ